jgi:starch phosphorylase
MQVSHYLPRELPDNLQELANLALDLRWSWHHGTDLLWQAIDADLRGATGNPWLIPESVSDQRLVDRIFGPIAD